MKKFSIRIFTGFAITLFLVLNAAGVFNMEFIKRLELWTYDYRLNLTMPKGQDTRIVIVDIDERSLSEDGRWPWSRNKVATIVENLFERYQAAVVGFDIVFAEKDNSSGLTVLEQFGKNELQGSAEYFAALEKIRPRLNYDNLLAEKLAGRQVVLGYYFSRAEESQKGQTVGMLPKPVFTKDNFRKGNTNVIRMNGYGANIPELQKKAASAGHFNPDPDVDGVTRRVPMLIEYQDSYYEPLSLAVVRVLLGMPDIKPGLPEGEGKSSGYEKLEWLSLSDMKIPVDDKVSALIPYRGNQGSFPYVSASDVLHGRVKPELLEGAIVLVGTTAPGLMDMRSTPVSSVYPGVEVHANMIAGILDQNIKYSPAYVMGAEVVILLFSGILLSILLPMLTPVKSNLLTVALLGSVIGINLVAWNNYHLVLPLASSITLIPMIYAFNMSYGFLVEARTKRQITGLFGQYVPPALVDVMSKNPENFSMEADSREMTVLFSDVRNFTTISEGLEPKQLSLMMNEYMSVMTNIIQKYNGTIDKYIGDAIMAFWGAPLRDPDHARNAVQAALEMQLAMDKIRKEFPARGWPELRIGIGVNTGVMRVGNMGSQFRMAYTVMGDAVNLGARLEGITKQYGVDILVGQETWAALHDYQMREVDRVRVKGKAEPVSIYEPLGLKKELDQTVFEGLYVYSQALEYYRLQDWEQAEKSMKELAEQAPERKIYQLYLDRIAHFRNTPPASDWDAVFEFTTK